jgi:uncharacterized membrane protein YccF (DUF307 family)
MDLSFHQKSLWVLFGGLICAFGFYFATVLKAPTVDITPHQLGLFSVAVAALVVMQIVGHVIVAVADRRTDADERDRLITLKGTRNGAHVLETGVFVALCTALLTRGNFLIANVLLAFWVLAELAKIGSRLWLYHRGV